MDGKSRLEQIQSLLRENPAETARIILDFFKAHYGGTGFLMRTLAEEAPDVFVRYVLEAERTLGPRRTLDPKTLELVALASATAVQCDHCQKAHIQGARANGATWEEILDTILVAAHTVESSALSIALRSYKQVKAKHSASVQTAAK